jgi:hypothetical protein
MPILYFGKSKQGKVITVQQALKLGIENKNNAKLFQMPKDYAINKKNNRLVKTKTAVNQLKKGKLKVQDIIFHGKEIKKEKQPISERNKFMKDIYKKLDIINAKLHALYSKL